MVRDNITFMQRVGNQDSGTPRIGIDLGGTKIEAIVMAENGSMICRERFDTPKNDYQQTLDKLVEIIQIVSTKMKLPTHLPIGIGTPGAVSLKTGLLMNCNSTCLNGQPLREDLELKTGRQVRIANDADCFTLSEASDGSGINEDIVFWRDTRHRCWRRHRISTATGSGRKRNLW